MRVCAEEMALLRRHRRAFAVGDARIGLQGRGFATQGQFSGLFAVDRPGVKQIQISQLMCDQIRIRQTRHRVFGGEARNIECSLHSSLYRCFGKVRGAGAAAPVADINRHTQRFVAVAFDVFQIAFSNGNAQSVALRGFGSGVSCTYFFGMRERAVDQRLKLGTAVAETRKGFVRGGMGSGM